MVYKQHPRVWYWIKKIKFNKLNHNLRKIFNFLLFIEILVKTNGVTDKLAMSLEKDNTGMGGHASITRQDAIKKKFYFLLKGSCRNFQSEDTCSVTIEETALGRVSISPILLCQKY